MIHHPPVVPPTLDNAIPAPWSSRGSQAQGSGSDSQAQGSKKQKSAVSRTASSAVRSDESFGTELDVESVSYVEETEGAGSAAGSRQNGGQRSELTYGQSFAISSRLRQVVRKRGWVQVCSGVVLLLALIGALIAALVVGLRNANLQEDRRNKINATPVNIPTEKQAIVGSIKDQPAQKREFSFVIDERLGKPDGYEKDMLVVNGS